VGVFSEQKISFYELVDISIQNSVHISYFHISAQVFYHPVGMEDIGTDLISPGDV